VAGIDTDGPDRFDGLFGQLQLLKWTLRMEPMQLGDCDLGSIAFEYKDEDLDWQRATIPLPRVKVVPGLVKNPDPATLRPIPDLPAPVSSQPVSIMRWLRWGGIGLFVATLLNWLVKAAAHRGLSRSLAAASLDELRQMEQNGESQVPRARINEVCGVVRKYLEQAYELRAPRQTTPEFLSDSRTAEVLSADQRTALAELLESADAERFAAADPSDDDYHRCLRRARAFLAGEPR
jgi:hypothetical protein